MGNVHVHVVNKTGGKVSLLLDENDERLDYFKKLVRRDELESVRVVSADGPKESAAEKKVRVAKEKAEAEAAAKAEADAKAAEDAR